MWGVLAGATAGLASGWADNLFNGYVGRKSQSTQAAHDYEMAAFNAAQNYLYSKKYNEQNYELAERYATNSALWSVLGLKKAGLNPILAANGGAGANFSQAGVMPSGSAGSSISGISGSSDSAESLRDGASLASTIASAKQMDSQASLNQKQEALTDANTAKAQADIEAIQANSARVRAETQGQIIDNAIRSKQLENYKWNRGQSGAWPFALEAAQNIGKDHLQTPTSLAGSLAGKIGKSVGSYFKRLGSLPSSPASAKQVGERSDRTDLDTSAKSSKARSDEEERKRQTFIQRAKSFLKRGFRKANNANSGLYLPF